MMACTLSWMYVLPSVFVLSRFITSFRSTRITAMESSKSACLLCGYVVHLSWPSFQALIISAFQRNVNQRPLEEYM